MSEADAHAYEVAGRFDLNWRGLAQILAEEGRQIVGGTVLRIPDAS